MSDDTQNTTSGGAHPLLRMKGLYEDLRAFAPVRTQARRLITLGVKAGRPWHAAATVGEVAKAARVTPEEVVRLVRSCGYLMQIEERQNVGIEGWIVWEDGE